MKLPPPEVLEKMSDEKLDALAEREAEEVILSAPPHQQLALRALWARTRGKNCKGNAEVSASRAQDVMMESFQEMRRKLNELSGKKK